jgi:predicted Zn-dependent protease
VLAELDRADQTAPDDPDALYLRGKVFLATHRDAEAETALRRSIEKRPMDPGPYYQLARLYQKLGKKDLAQDTLARMQSLKNLPAK